ncbi:N-formylglutamate amidohydrolase [Sphingomonas zeicaulis]|uniref:N-formylglutamate amidohydrolase n=1 Tax=Sphingomonas zeicaulis TaxID=1632740 RepID=UPI003D1C9B71
MADPQPFRRIGPALLTSPVVLSVPHAGRDYPADLAAMLRIPVQAAESLEDRHADLLARQAAESGGVAGLVARVPRLLIDLNRAEQEIDPEMTDPPLRGTALIPSAKVRGGLGLVPRRLHPYGDIWRQTLSVDALATRIRTVHRPYHEALAQLLAQARMRFGVAVLIDLHSMPPIRPIGSHAPARIVIGDRFGRSAAARITARAVAEARVAGLPAAINAPYAGAHMLDRHGNPRGGIHAIQLEIDRSLYLASGLREPGEALPHIAGFVAALAAGLAEEVTGWRDSAAAE